MLLLAFCGLTLPAAADFSALTPEGWRGGEAREHWTFTSPDGEGVGHAHLNLHGDLEHLSDLSARHNEPPDTYLIHDQGRMEVLGGLVTMRLFARWGDDERFLASSSVIPHRSGGHIICRIFAPMPEDAAPVVVSDFLGACHDEALGAE